MAWLLVGFEPAMTITVRASSPRERKPVDASDMRQALIIAETWWRDGWTGITIDGVGWPMPEMAALPPDADH